MKDKRKFEGKIYELSACKKLKSDAVSYASHYRSMGWKARVVKVKYGTRYGW